jgi:hypothetical protein
VALQARSRALPSPRWPSVDRSRLGGACFARAKGNRAFRVSHWSYVARNLIQATPDTGREWHEPFSRQRQVDSMSPNRAEGHSPRIPTCRQPGPERPPRGSKRINTSTVFVFIRNDPPRGRIGPESRVPPLSNAEQSGLPDKQRRGDFIECLFTARAGLIARTLSLSLDSMRQTSSADETQ